tara:strand:- start:3698 stop:4651 length:954 start_codon:yes stop_codon:yes gene_type:complete
MSINKLSGVAYSSINKISGVAKSGVSKIKGITPSYFLDDHAGSVCAYALRQLSSTATYAITVENSSGSTADIGFTAAGGLDTSALATHCGSNYGRVSKWWDQSGNSNHMEQSSATSRPYIVDASGNLITTTDSSIPAIDFYFSSTARWLEDTFVSNNSDRLMLSLMAEFRSVTAGQSIFNQWTSSQSTQVFQINILGAASDLRIAARFGTSSKHLGRCQTNAQVAVDTEYLVVGSLDHASGDLDVNGDTADTDTGFPGSSGSGLINNGSILTAIGRRSDNGASQYTGFLSEVVMWSDASLPTQNDVMTDMNTHYSVF